MKTKNDVEVVINGKQYTMSGYESSEYLQRIATHINDKLAELKNEDGYNRLDSDMRNVLLMINLSDDYHKAMQATDELQNEYTETEKEMFDIKHQMIDLTAEIEKLKTENETLKKQYDDASHQIIRLETELGKYNVNYKKKNKGEKSDKSEKNKIEKNDKEKLDK